MKNTAQSIGFYALQLKDSIPVEAFREARYKLNFMFSHVTHIILQLIILRYYIDNKLILVFSSVFIGVSIACLFLYSHEFSHGTIIRQKKKRYLLEVFFWSFSGIPATVWERVHNHTHHHHMNSYGDPDRKTFKSEDGFFSRFYNIFIYPNRVLKYSFTVGFAMIFYASKHTLAVFYKGRKMPKIVTAKPEYSKNEVRSVFYEFLFIVAMQVGMFLIVSDWKYVWVLLISWYVYSSGVILFIVTQHLRNPVFKDSSDPVLTTTSVIIPTWLDKIIDWHSYHVEHHIFPGINFDYYPYVSKALTEKFPDQYERMKFWKAVKESYEKDILLDDPLE